MGRAIVGDRHGDPIEVQADPGERQLVYFGRIPEGEGIDECLGNIYDLARDLWVLRCNGPESPVCELTQEGHIELQIGDAAATNCDATVPLNGMPWWGCGPARNLGRDQ